MCCSQGGTGNDKLQARTVRAAPGSRGDTIKGGPGNDSLVGLGGPDRLSGSSGNDRIDATASDDQTAERVSCGSGTDKFVGDTASATHEWQDRGSSCESLWDVSVDPF